LTVQKVVNGFVPTFLLVTLQFAFPLNRLSKSSIAVMVGQMTAVKDKATLTSDGFHPSCG
jgi:hypothetical protein